MEHRPPGVGHIVDGPQLPELQPNNEVLLIIRLYLEKRDGMSEEERALFLKVIASFSLPRMYI